MLLVGLMGVMATRSLYDSSVLPPPVHGEDGTSVCGEPGELELAPALPSELSPRPASIGIHQPTFKSPDKPWQEEQRFCCFCLQPPAFSPPRCARALIATFSGLTMWVGLWDLIEDHVLPTVFHTCRNEPSLGCACVKLALVAVGAAGLFVTRSLYGEHGISVQFQRL